jgi:hypothetical protein
LHLHSILAKINTMEMCGIHSSMARCKSWLSLADQLEQSCTFIPHPTELDSLALAALMRTSCELPMASAHANRYDASQCLIYNVSHCSTQAASCQ